MVEEAVEDVAEVDGSVVEVASQRPVGSVQCCPSQQ